MRFVPTKIAAALMELERTHTLSVQETSKSLIAWLRRKHLLRSLPEVVAALEYLTAKESQTKQITATLAHTPDPSVKRLIEDRAQTLFGKDEAKVHVTFAEDSSLIGGVRLATADTQYDFSLRRKLQALRSQL